MSSKLSTSLSQLDGINPSLTRYGRNEPAPVLPLREEPDLLSWLETSGRLVADEETAAADARGLRLDHAQHHLDRNRRVHRRAAAFQHVEAGLDRHGIRRRHHALRFGGCRAMEAQQRKTENESAAEPHALPSSTSCDDEQASKGKERDAVGPRRICLGQQRGVVVEEG